MAKKNTKLSVVKTSTQTHEERERELDELHDKERKRWEELERQSRISSHSARQRVLALRDELERYRLQLEGATFGVATSDECGIPSLDGGNRKFTVYLAADLNPVIERLYDEIDRFAKMHGPSIYRQVDFESKLFDLKEQSVETGFKIGMLAGVILSGAPKDVVDRYERGLAYVMQSDRRVVKK